MMIWRVWQSIVRMISDIGDISDEQRGVLEEALAEFRSLYQTVYGTKCCTPYFHVITEHTIELLSEHKSIGKFSQQGFEAANRFHRQLYVSSTSHDGGAHPVSSSKQVLQKLFRILFAEAFFELDSNRNQNFLEFLDQFQVKYKIELKP